MTKASHIEVRIPEPLREHAGGADALEVYAGSVREALRVLRESHPNLVQRILTRGGDLRTYVRLFLDDEDVRSLDGLDTRLQDGRILQIVPSVAGG